MHINTWSSLWLLLILFMGCNRLQEKKAQPNIVLILADDLGYSDVGYMHYKEGIRTPNIDRLAISGMVFSDAYAACTVCSPTRASLMTGKYPATLKLTNHIPGKPMEAYLESGGGRSVSFPPSLNSGQILPSITYGHRGHSW